MAENKGSPGLSKLARVISQRAENVAGKAERDLVLDFGSIKGDMSLLTNTFPIPIPRSDYHVCRLVGGLAYTISGGSHGGHEGGNGSHTHTAKPSFAQLVVILFTRKPYAYGQATTDQARGPRSGCLGAK